MSIRGILVPVLGCGGLRARLRIRTAPWGVGPAHIPAFTVCEAALATMAQKAPRLREKGTVMKDPKLTKEAALKIDLNTAEVKWERASSDLADDKWNGWSFFARAPQSHVWVPFDDLPDETCKALLRKRREKDPFVPLTRDDLDENEQKVIDMAEKFPEAFDDIGFNGRIGPHGRATAEERAKAWWRSRGRGEKLLEAVRRGRGRKPD